jgi:hypothetical protein
MFKPRVTTEQEQALHASQGLVQAEGRDGDVILMSMDVYREMLGVSSDQELAASVTALQQSMKEARQGKTRPLTDALDDLGRKYEV